MKKQRKLSAKGNDIILLCKSTQLWNWYEKRKGNRTKLSWNIILIFCCCWIQARWEFHEKKVHMLMRVSGKHELVIWRRLKGFSTKKSNTTIIRLDFHEKLNELCVRTFIPFVEQSQLTQFVKKPYTAISAFEVMRKEFNELESLKIFELFSFLPICIGRHRGGKFTRHVAWF